MAFLLFLLVNAALFLRPSEIVPELATVPVYEVLILSTITVALPGILARFRERTLLERPLTLCVLGLLAAVMLSHLSRFDTWYARMYGTDFLKIVLYYLALIGAVDTPGRLVLFLRWLVVLILINTSLAVLQYHHYIDVPSLRPLAREDFLQLRGTGVFNDPNDLALVLVVGLTLGTWLWGDRRAGLLRLLGPVAILEFGYALLLTKSRGGFLAFLGALLVLLMSRFGWKRAIPLALVILPAMFLVFSGRQTELSIGEGTAQQRIQLWSGGLVLFRQAPLFGIGVGNYSEELGHVAHNSFVQAYTEMGLFGGVLFVGAFYLGIRTLQQLHPARACVVDPELARLRPYLLAMVVGYAVGLFSLSRNYIVPTYLIIGLPEVYDGLTATDPPVPFLRLDRGLALRLAGVGLLALVGLYAFVRVFARWG